MAAADYLHSLLCNKVRGLSSNGIRSALTQNEGRNEIAEIVLQRAKVNFEEARRKFFSRPVVTLPFAVKKTTLQKSLLPEDGFREIMYKTLTTREDDKFQFRNFVTNHWIIRHVITECDPSCTLRENSNFQIVTDGIKHYDYALTHRTVVPFHTFESGESSSRLTTVMITNAFYSVRSIDDLIIDMFTTNSTTGTFLVIPYERDMWHNICNNSKHGGYRYYWQRSKTKVNRGFNLTLNANFFSSASYEDYELRIQPANSTHVMTISRAQFIKLFEPSYRGDVSRTMVRHVAGFAILDYSGIQFTEQVKIKLTYIDGKKLNEGFNYIAPNNVTLKEPWSMRSYTLVDLNGYYLESGFIDMLKKIMLSTPVTNKILENIMLQAFSFTPRIKFHKDEVICCGMMSPEILCHVIEYLLPEIMLIKLRLLRVQLTTVIEKIDDLKLTLPLLMKTIVSKFSKETSVGLQPIVEFESELSLASKRMNYSPQITITDTFSKSSVMTPKRIEFITEIIDRVEPFFSTSPYYTQKLIRTPVNKRANDTLLVQIKESLVYNNEFDVPVEMIQHIYDELFPGNSTLDYTALQMQAEVGDKSIILAVPYFRVSYARIYSDKSERLLIPSKLRTSTSADLAGSFSDMMGALMKRNFNRQASEVAGDKRLFVKRSVSKVLNNYGVKPWQELVGHFKLVPITPGMEALRLWADKHSESDVKAAAAIITNDFTDPSKYNAMPKAQTKPILDLTAQGSLAVGQTVVFHSKDIIALSVGIFTLTLERLLLLFPDSVRFAFGTDEHTVGEWADKYLDLENTFIYEFDVPKFDKSQDQTCFTLILEVLKLVGVSDEFVNYWERASYTASVFNTQFSMMFKLFYGNRSGSGGTLAVNCICLLFAFYTEFSNLGIVATLIKGDDSVMVTKAELTDAHVLRLLDRWGFSLKRREIKQYVSFCSGVFVKSSSGSYMLLRDPVRLLTKLGRALSPEKESSYFIDYYVSFVDATCQYNDDVALSNLKLAVFSLYNKMVDVDSIVQFLRRIVVSYKVFLKELYGFNDKSLALVAKLDTAADILAYAKQQGFIKSSMLKDVCPTLKLPLVEKIRSYTSEMIFEIKTNDNNNSLELTEDKIDKLGWVFSM